MKSLITFIFHTQNIFVVVLLGTPLCCTKGEGLVFGYFYESLPFDDKYHFSACLY